MNYQARYYRDQSDTDLMVALLLGIRPSAWAKDYPSAIDLREIMENVSIWSKTMLWFSSEGQLVCFAFVDQYANFRFELVPELYGSVIEPELSRFVVNAANQAGYKTLSTNSRLEDTRRVQMLKEHGFLEQSARTLSFLCDLSQPINKPNLPNGFCIRSLSGDGEIAALVDLHQAAFGTNHMTVAQRSLIMGAPDYDPSLDLVVVDPDGQLAAYCFAMIESDQSMDLGSVIGMIDVIATHPDYQEKGLARALILTELEIFRQRGLPNVALGTLNQNTAMVHLAHTTGFAVSYERVWFEKWF